jgi:hypothetical protein
MARPGVTAAVGERPAGASAHAAPASPPAEPVPPGGHRASAHHAAHGEHITPLLDDFDTISLQDASAASLMDRLDRKFLLQSGLLAHILKAARTDYRALVVQGTSGSRYSTCYYDTPDLGFYRAHHGDRFPRHKVRVRWYMDSGERYLELKHKTNRERTLKTRALLPASWTAPDRIGAELFAWMGARVPFPELEKSLVVDFTRITLVRRDMKERITFDLGVRASVGERSCHFPRVVIAELKQERSARSPMLEVLRGMHLRQGSLSKYCLGIASLRPGVKTNQFRETFRRIESLDRLRPLSANG